MLEYLQLRKNKVHKFRPRVELSSARGSFILKTVKDPEELIEALRLRYEVFHREFAGKSKMRGLDVDEFDFSCDHLIIQEAQTRQVIGTYRLNCSQFSQRFYSAREFNLRRIFEKPGTKLELGRACIHKDFRRGAVISLLWRGIAEYMLATQSDLMFGCASIKTQSPRQAALLYSHFAREGLFHSDIWSPPTLPYSMPGLGPWIQRFDRPLSSDEISEVEGLLPPLCRAYVKAGAQFGGEPAYDPDFKCIDFLTVLSMENLNKALWRKYSPWPKQSEA